MSSSDPTTAYFDESRVDDSHRFAVVAGLCNTYDIWTVFETKWKQAAKDIPEDKIKKHFRYRPSKYNSPEDEKRFRDALILAKVIGDFTLWPLHAALEQEKFKPYFDALRGKERDMPLLSSAYTVCSFACCEVLDQIASDIKLRDIWRPIKVVFYKGNENEYWLEKGYEAYYGTKPETSLKRNPVFEYDDDLIPLKAADAYAWLLSRKYNEDEELEALKVIESGGWGKKIDLTGKRADEILQVVESKYGPNAKKSEAPQ